MHAHAADGAQVESEAAVERRAFDKLQRQMGVTSANGTGTAAHTSSSTAAANQHSTATGHSGTRTAADKLEPPNIDDYIQQKKVVQYERSACMHAHCSVCTHDTHSTLFNYISC
jgi:hypothetical protein